MLALHDLTTSSTTHAHGVHTPRYTTMSISTIHLWMEVISGELKWCYLGVCIHRSTLFYGGYRNKDGGGW